jgi:Tfp pilus assembly protein PilO
MTLPPQVTLLIVVALVAGCTIVLWPIVRALARRLEGRQVAPDPAVQSELAQLRARVADFDQLQHRVAELEERLDFAERLLAQRHEADRLPRG